MSGWGGGYVTDVTYMPGYYRHQSPHLTLACLMGGVAASTAGARRAAQLSGTRAAARASARCCLAASNPSGCHRHRLQPGPYRRGARLGGEGRDRQIRFIEADLSTLAGERPPAAVPEADFVSLHGLWSWVRRRSATGIVRLLGDKVRPGGVVHVSYNALPVMGPRARDAAAASRSWTRNSAARSDRAGRRGLRNCAGAHAAGAYQLVRSQWMTTLIQGMALLTTSYLAHEYMNDVATVLSCRRGQGAGRVRSSIGSHPPTW